jgi:ankyrin repeat protein
MDTLDSLRKEASHWLREVRKQNPGHVKRLRLAYPDAPATPTLRDIQHALAREHGHEGWRAMTAAIRREHGRSSAEHVPLERRPPSDRLLELACWDHTVHGRGDDVSREGAARRLIEKHPDVGRANVYTAVVCGELAEVERMIAQAPALAKTKGGPRNWEPILYLCYGRVSTAAAAQHAMAIARTLLDHGADPNAYYMAGDALYGALVGVAGEGEQDASPHRLRDELYALLLDRGAELYDIQVLYNTHFRGDLLWWLERTYAHAAKTGRQADWRDPDWPMLDMGGYGSGARFCLSTAIRHNDVPLARWLLEHGANPNAAPPRAPVLSRRNLYEEALVAGCDEIAALLRQSGATVTEPTGTGEDAFIVAALRGDVDRARELAAAHPEYVRSPKALFRAVELKRPDLVELLLDLGVPVDIEDEQKQRALHVAASGNAVDMAAVLIARGADVDAPEARFGAPPIGFAAYGHHTAMVDLLAPVSRCVPVLARQGKVDRLKQVLRDDPGAAKAVFDEGTTLLWWLPDDDATAARVAELLLASGCDPATVARDGTTAADRARARGLDQAAALLAEAFRTSPRPEPD